MLKAKNLSQLVTLMAGNKQVNEYVHLLLEAEGISKLPLAKGETVELKTDKVCVTITENTMTAMNVYGTVFEDLTRKDCKLKVLKERGKVKYDKKDRRNR